ncbi:MAG: RNA polymerase sigma factor [Gemmatimonadales bacterium]
MVEQQFERIVQLHGPALRRLALAYGRTTADGDDLFQEICFAIWRSLPTFRGECSERTFAFRIGHNRGLTHRSRRRPEPVELDEAARDERPGPDAIVVAATERDRLLDAIRQLGDGHRQVVLLSLEGLSHGEIGEVLGISENNVAVRLSRARKELRAILGAPGGEP